MLKKKKKKLCYHQIGSNLNLAFFKTIIITVWMSLLTIIPRSYPNNLYLILWWYLESDVQSHIIQQQCFWNKITLCSYYSNYLVTLTYLTAWRWKLSTNYFLLLLVYVYIICIFLSSQYITFFKSGMAWISLRCSHPLH